MAKKQLDTSLATKWKKRYDIASSNQQPLFARFEKWYDIMYAAYNADSMAPWRSKIYIPILSSKAWDLISKFTGIRPGFQVSIRDEEPDGETKERAARAQKKLEYDYDNPLLDEPMKDKLFGPLLDSIVCGTGVAKPVWKVKKVEQKAHPILGDGIYVDHEQEIVQSGEYGCNDLVPVNIFNVFKSPASTHIQDGWTIIREFNTLKKLEEANDGVQVYKNLDKLKDARANSDPMSQYSSARNRLLSEKDKVSADETVDLIETFECYDSDTNEILTFASAGIEKGKKEEQWIEIRKQENPYWHGKQPLVAFYTKRKPYEFWGESLFETNERLQAAVNDIFNHYMDNWNLSIDGMIMTEEGASISDFILEPGGEFVYRGDQPKQFKFPEPNPQQLSIVMNVLEQAIEQSTLPQYASGIPDSATDKTAGTATGITRLMEAANDKIGFMRSNFQQSLRLIGQMWLSNNQQFMDRPVMINATKGNSVEPTTVTPADMQGIMDLRIDDASMEPQSKQEKREQYMTWFMHMMELKNASAEQAAMNKTPEDVIRLNFPEIAQEGSEHFGKRDFEKYILENVAPQPEQPEEQPMEAGLPEMELPEEPMDEGFGEFPAQMDQPEPLGPAEQELGVY